MSWVAGHLNTLTWNVYTKQDAADIAPDLRLLIAKHDPDVICLQEATKCGRGLRRRFKKDWRVIYFRGWSEAEQLVTMVHRRKKVPRSTYLKMALSWIGPKHGWLHAGRTFHVVDVGPRHRVVNIHRVTGGPEGRNAESFQEEHRRLLELSRKRGSKRRNFYILGDWNMGHDSGYARVFAAALDGGIIVATPEARIDYGIARGGENIRRFRGRAWRHRKYGSDHPVVRIQFDWMRAKVDK